MVPQRLVWSLQPCHGSRMRFLGRTGALFAVVADVFVQTGLQCSTDSNVRRRWDADLIVPKKLSMAALSVAASGTCFARSQGSATAETDVAAGSGRPRPLGVERARVVDQDSLSQLLVPGPAAHRRQQLGGIGDWRDPQMRPVAAPEQPLGIGLQQRFVERACQPPKSGAFSRLR